MDIIAGKVLLVGCCVWAAYVVFRIGSNLLSAKKKSRLFSLAEKG